MDRGRFIQWVAATLIVALGVGRACRRLRRRDGRAVDVSLSSSAWTPCAALTEAIPNGEAAFDDPVPVKAHATRSLMRLERLAQSPPAAPRTPQRLPSSVLAPFRRNEPSALHATLLASDDGRAATEATRGAVECTLRPVTFRKYTAAFLRVGALSSSLTLLLQFGCGGKSESRNTGPVEMKPLEACLRYESVMNSCFHRNVSFAHQAELMPTSEADRERIETMCSDNLARVQTACR
jgi:hypothetical protein